MAAAATLPAASPTALGAASCCCGRSHGRYVPPSVRWWLQAPTDTCRLYPGQAHTCAMVAAANRGAHSKNAATQLATAAAAALAGGQAGATQVTLSKVQGQQLIAAQGKSKLCDNPSLVNPPPLNCLSPPTCAAARVYHLVVHPKRLATLRQHAEVAAVQAASRASAPARDMVRQAAGWKQCVVC